MEKVKRCVIAVGSTQFDELIQALDNEEYIQALLKAGFNHLVVQMGK